MLRHHDEHQAIQQDRAARQTREWRDRYQWRNGIDATVSRGVRAYGLRRTDTAAGPRHTSLDCSTPRIDARISRFEALRPAA
ncbi:hypothetical protein AB0J57_17995 [Streptomyces sp. NPDC049837]|uniref:hypothetical protein n=1 Tax=Streptomyces sp. NPDC049837 TaxID=3155277 RepID=UPI0034356D82